MLLFLHILHVGFNLLGIQELYINQPGFAVLIKKMGLITNFML